MMIRQFIALALFSALVLHISFCTVGLILCVTAAIESDEEYDEVEQDVDLAASADSATHCPDSTRLAPAAGR